MSALIARVSDQICRIIFSLFSRKICSRMKRDAAFTAVPYSASTRRHKRWYSAPVRRKQIFRSRRASDEPVVDFAMVVSHVAERALHWVRIQLGEDLLRALGAVKREALRRRRI